jgi:hypothetical protein
MLFLRIRIHSEHKLFARLEFTNKTQMGRIRDERSFLFSITVFNELYLTPIDIELIDINNTSIHRHIFFPRDSDYYCEQNDLSNIDIDVVDIDPVNDMYNLFKTTGTPKQSPRIDEVVIFKKNVKINV